MGKENRDKLLVLRLNTIEYSKVKDMADKQGVTVSELCRKLILEKIDVVKDYVKKSVFGQASKFRELKEKIDELYHST